VSVVCHSLNFHILIFSRTTGSNWTKLWCDTLWMPLFQNCVHWPCLILKMASHWLKNWKSLKIFFRTTEWIETRISQNAGTAHPPRADKSSLKSDHCFYPVWYTNYNRLSCNSWFNLTRWFLRRSKYENVMDDRQQTQSDGKNSFEPLALVN
jgi:hypothetical protein